MKKSFEEPQMQIIIFGSRDTVIVTSNPFDAADVSGGTNGGARSVLSNDTVSDS